MANTNANTTPAATTASKAKPAPAKPAPAKPAAKPSKPAPAAPAAVTLPPANVVACPAKGRTTTMAGMAGGTYGIACTLPAPAGTSAAGTTSTVVLPFTLPTWAGKAGQPVTVRVASMAPNWLGRNGHPLRAHLCQSPNGTVSVQPHNSGGVQVNAYPAALAGTGITATQMGAVQEGDAS